MENERFPGGLAFAALTGASPEWTEGYRRGWETAGLCRATKFRNSDTELEKSMLRLIESVGLNPVSESSNNFRIEGRYRDAGDGYVTGFKERLSTSN